jgi:membrane fusion protein (multidrug efflux system)
LRKLQLFAICAIFIAPACSKKPKSVDKFNPNAPISIDISIVENQKVDKLIEVNGTVLANDYIDVHPESNGRIVFLQIPEGKMVKAGTVLAKLNDAELQAQYEKVKVQLELANINEQRNKQLLNVKGINQSDYDISLQQVKSLKADIALIQAQIDKTIIKAPFNGLVGLRQVSLGAFINNTSTIASLQKIDQLKIDFTLPEFYQNFIKVGKKVKIESIGGGDAKLAATVIAIEPQINASTRNIKVRAALQGKLLPGSYVKVLLGENVQKPTIMVPANIVIPDSRSKQLSIVKGGEAKLIDVETGYRTASSVEITKGLEVGDSIIVSGMLFVRQGSKVKIGKTINITDITK